MTRCADVNTSISGASVHKLLLDISAFGPLVTQGLSPRLPLLNSVERPAARMQHGRTNGPEIGFPDPSRFHRNAEVRPFPQARSRAFARRQAGVAQGLWPCGAGGRLLLVISPPWRARSDAVRRFRNALTGALRTSRGGSNTPSAKRIRGQGTKLAEASWKEQPGQSGRKHGRRLVRETSSSGHCMDGL